MNKESVHSWLEAHQAELIRSMQESIAFASVKSESAPNAPFGKEIRGCLDHALKLAADMGFATKDLDGYAGCVDYGSGEELVGVLAHLDVVPEGSGWTYPPYGGELHDGKLYGRGVLDDKGPAIITLYSLKAIREAGLPMKRRIRLILGCDEESGMECLEHYCAVEEIPTMSFSPDAEYPLVNSEKNSFGAEYGRVYASALTVTAGERHNVVPGECDATVPLNAAAIPAYKREGYTLTVTPLDEGRCALHMAGQSSHASLPEQGRNAVCAMLELLSSLPLPEEDAKTVKALWESFGLEVHGESFGLDKSDASGRLTLCAGGVLRWDEKGLQRLSVDIRAPISVGEEEIFTALNKRLNAAGISAPEHSFSQGYCIPRESELVTKLLGVYEKYTGEKAEPLAIGGGTYARHLPNAVAFGPEIPGHPAWIHMPDEYITLEDMMFNVHILAEAIMDLCCE